MAGKSKGAHKDKQLSAAFVRSVTEPGTYIDGNGLMLKVDKSGAKRWVQRLMVSGARVDMGLGPVSLVSLADARAKALDNRRVARSGGDPRPEKVAVAPSFTEAMEKVLARKEAEFSNAKHRLQWRSTLETYALPIIGRMKLSDIEPSDILRVLSQEVDGEGGSLWQARTETATRLRRRIEAVLSWATVAGHRSGDNPARWKGNLDHMLPAPSKISETIHHPALKLSDAQRWWRQLTRREGMAALALSFLALTWARSGEVRAMEWDEVDLDKAMWVVPARKMKMGREHRVPLPSQAVDLLKKVPREGDSPLVFPAPRGGLLSDMSLSACMRRMHEFSVENDLGGYFDPRSGRPAVPHGLRSTARDWAAEHGFERDLAEIALAHDVGEVTERAYRRTDMLERRRAMLAEWANFLTAAQIADRVVRIRRAR
ncbi:tyrosine-type recombinase/integrase [Albidovulum sediminis]|uniref:Tyrosine-type recombinase/integrase n=1 Tax=Albidovulum sediminis TaxID=3066345 RepID=A0ABT2NPP6_9RHOB|nr:site-specific integrase [Defluviimonas sediminis]MCT8330912.1 tyrosine-type recombinase/integrase [Defluviimonas sediminis]